MGGSIRSSCVPKPPAREVYLSPGETLSDLVETLRDGNSGGLQKGHSYVTSAAHST